MAAEQAESNVALHAPFPYFGGKSKVAGLVWQALGDVQLFAEPFLGSAAVMLARPREHLVRPRLEILNDADGLVVNFWRAIKRDSRAVAR